MTNEEAINRLLCGNTAHSCKADYIKLAIEALRKLNRITEILDETDFHNAVSYNKDGEDFGYQESICEISLVVDGKERWLE